MTVEEPKFPIRKASHSARRAFFIALVIFCAAVPWTNLARTGSAGSTGSPGSPGSEGAKLRYRFKPGTSYAMVVALDLAMETQVDGLPAQAAALAAAGKDMKQQTSLKLHLEAGPAGADGSQALTVRVDDAQAQLSRQGQVIRVQGLEERLEGSVLLGGTLSSDGRSLELAPRSGADVPDASREILGLMLQMLPSFPDRTLIPGDSFEVPVRFTAPELGPDVKLETRGICVYTLRSIEGGRARFDVRAEGTADSSGDPTQRITLKVDNHGTAEFDIAEGLFTALRSDLSIDLALDTEVPNPSVPAGASPDFTPSASLKLQVRASAKGPLEFEMARVAARAK